MLKTIGGRVARVAGQFCRVGKKTFVAITVGGTLVWAQVASAVTPDPADVTTGLQTLYDNAATIGIGTVILGAGVAFVMRGLFLRKGK